MAVRERRGDVGAARTRRQEEERTKESPGLQPDLHPVPVHSQPEPRSRAAAGQARGRSGGELRARALWAQRARAADGGSWIASAGAGRRACRAGIGSGTGGKAAQALACASVSVGAQQHSWVACPNAFGLGRRGADRTSGRVPIGIRCGISAWALVSSVLVFDIHFFFVRGS